MTYIWSVVHHLTTMKGVPSLEGAQTLHQYHRCVSWCLWYKCWWPPKLYEHLQETLVHPVPSSKILISCFFKRRIISACYKFMAHNQKKVAQEACTWVLTVFQHLEFLFYMRSEMRWVLSAKSSILIHNIAGLSQEVYIHKRSVVQILERFPS